MAMGWEVKIVSRKQALSNEFVRLNQELEEVYQRLNEVRPPKVNPVKVTKETLKEYELLLVRKTQIEKRVREITEEMLEADVEKKERRSKK